MGGSSKIRSVQTCIPALGVAFVRITKPDLTPGVGKVNQKDELDEDEEERPHHTEVEPHWSGEKERKELMLGIFISF